MILFLFIIVVISLLMSVLTVYDDSPLAMSIDFLMKGLVVLCVGIYLLSYYFN